ncbi:olfactory receptor 1020-like isoform X2 [Eublepharis macularius]|uniref:Olfactory receptor n=1 Tax=Eublepharis macularius TaxID=481883 RepID=A0AA97KRB5_EUBMA|nr:olfactory receptor 1020-like isoform X2 [Eublepharis macularius]
MVRTLIMDKENYTTMNEFILLGLTDRPELQIPLFVIFLWIYAVSLVGNLGMVVLIGIDSRLHTPMYFFLCHLSFVDFCYSTVITPKMLVNFVADVNVISFSECAVQFYLFGSCAGIEGFLLAAMAYDRYNAICNPLLYKAIMSWKVCAYLVIASFLAGFINAAIHTYFTFQLQFCDSNIINHFFCDTPPLLALSCSDIHINLIIIFVFATFNELSCLLTILVSYSYILSAILRISTSEGRHRAFSTCASHLLAVTIFFGTILFMYLRPSSSHSMDQDKIVSVFYTVMIPMLNPLIYSLRNREVKDAVKKAVGRKIF